MCFIWGVAHSKENITFSKCNLLCACMGNTHHRVKQGTFAGAPGWLSWLSDQLLISTPVMISGFMSSRPTSGSGLTMGSLLGILSLCPFPARVCVCLRALSLKINIKEKKTFPLDNSSFFWYLVLNTCATQVTCDGGRSNWDFRSTPLTSTWQWIP